MLTGLVPKAIVREGERKTELGIEGRRNEDGSADPRERKFAEIRVGYAEDTYNRWSSSVTNGKHLVGKMESVEN